MMGLRIRIETFTGELNECRKQSTIIDKENGNLKRELEKVTNGLARFLEGKARPFLRKP